jgi:3-oxoacyl-[acyl-carrier-protein] synthase II
MRPVIVVSGIGCFTPAGEGVTNLLQAIREGNSFVKKLAGMEDIEGVCRIGAPVEDFDPDNFLERKILKRLDRSAQLFAAACSMAVKDSGILKQRIDPDRAGIFEGTSLGGLQSAFRGYDDYLECGFRGINPLTVNKAMTGAGASAVSISHAFHGPVMTVANESVSSAYAISTAIDQLVQKKIDIAVVGGAETPLFKEILLLFSRAKLLSQQNQNPQQACKPFDLHRDGTVLGEAGGALVLERLADAKRRDAPVYAKISAPAFVSDAHSLVSPRPDGRYLARAIRLALTSGGIELRDINYISAHGTGTKLNDRMETLSIKKAFGDRAGQIPVSSSKSMLGHCLGACTVIEVIKVIVAMNHNIIPPTVNLTIPDPECDLDYVPGRFRKGTINAALVLNSSFGGKNSALVLKRHIL